MKFTRSLLIAISLGLAAPAAVLAQSDYPNRPVRMISPYSAGGIVDSISRILAEKLSAKYGQPFVVENKIGAGGGIGMNYVRTAPPDGYTLMVASPALALLPIVNANAKWDVGQDFRAIEGIGVVPNIIVVHPSVPAKSMAEFIELAKKSEAPITYGTAGAGSSNQMAGEALMQDAGIKLTEVPYKGQSDAIADLLTGRVQMMALTSALAIPHIKEGKLRPLAVTIGKRSVAMPDLPTVAEAGKLPGYDVGTWFGLVGQKKLPDAIVEKLSKDVAEILAMPDVKARFDTLAMELDPMPPAEFDKYMMGEYTKWSKILKQAGVSVQ